MKREYKSGDFVRHAKIGATAQLLTKERSSSYWTVDLYPFSGDPNNKACWHEDDFEMSVAAGQPSPMQEQVGGDHYITMAIQPAEFIHKNGIGFIEGSAISYLSRWRAKGGIQDVEKAIHMLQMLVSMEQAQEDHEPVCAPGAQTEEPAWKVGRFQPGDKVQHKFHGEVELVKVVSSALTGKVWMAKLSNGTTDWCSESMMLPAEHRETEPMFKVGDRVRLNGTGECGNIAAQLASEVWRIRFDRHESEFSKEIPATDVDDSKPK